VAGVDEAKEELKEIIDYLREPAKFQKLADAFPRAFCSWALREPAKRCWRVPWPAKRSAVFFDLGLRFC